MKKTSVHEEGLPEIAESRCKKPLLIIFLGGILILLGIHFYFNQKKQSMHEFPLEEAYTIPKSEEKQRITTNRVEKTIPVIEKKSLSEQELTFLETKQKELQQRLMAPMLVANAVGDKPVNSFGSSLSPEKKALTTFSDPNTLFLQQARVRSEKTIHATHLTALNQIIGEGHVIHALLETAINSDLPGSLRALIDQPVYAEDGSHVLIPSGSRLIGQYKSGMLQGQSRIFVVWTRVITPNGVSVNLGFRGIDSLGMSGMAADTIDHHFWRQFGNAVLLSVLGAGTSNMGVTNNTPYNAAQAYRMAISNSLNQTAQQTLQQGIIPPTLWIHQGTPLQVFVAHDVDFSSVKKETLSRITIF